MDPDFTALLIHRADLFRSAETVGASKHPTTGYSGTPFATAVPCRLKPVRQGSKQVVAGMVFDSTHKVYFQAGQVLRITDLVVVSGATYQVMGVERPPDDVGEHHVTAHVKQVPV